MIQTLVAYPEFLHTTHPLHVLLIICGTAFRGSTVMLELLRTAIGRIRASVVVHLMHTFVRAFARHLGVSDLSRTFVNEAADSSDGDKDCKEGRGAKALSRN